MRRFLPELGTAVRITVLLMVLTGIIYPLAVTGVAQALFHDRANGSLIKRDGQVVGSSLIGQNFSSDRYFQGRPSATLSTDATPVPQAYNAANSGPSNLGPTNPALIAAVQSNADAVRCREGLPPGPPPIVPPAASPTADAAASPPATSSTTPAPAPCAAVTQPANEVPVDAVTNSASGLDPDISVAYAMLQAPRVAAARGLPVAQVQKLVQDNLLDRQFGILGERRLNVLRLNLALDAVSAGAGK